MIRQTCTPVYAHPSSVRNVQFPKTRTREASTLLDGSHATNRVIETELLLARAILTGRLIDSTHGYAIVVGPWSHDVIGTTQRAAACVGVYYAGIALRVSAGFSLDPVCSSFCLPGWPYRREPIAGTFDSLSKAFDFVQPSSTEYRTEHRNRNYSGTAVQNYRGDLLWTLYWLHVGMDHPLWRWRENLASFFEAT